MAGTMRAAAGSVLGLVALQAVSTRGGSGRVAEAFRDINTMVDRLLDPNVPAIPNLAGGEQWGTTARVPASSGGSTSGRVPVPAAPAPFKTKN